MSDADPPTELSAEVRLSTGLAVMQSFQQTIQHADSKANLVVAVQAGALAALAAGYDPPDVPDAAWRQALVLICAGCCALCFLASVFCVAQVVRARITPPPGPNRFAFPWVARMGAPAEPAEPATLLLEIWSLSQRLAGIAVLKHRWLNRAIGCLTVAVFAGSAAWLLAVTG
ncbi:hypothetical protein KIH74_30270 [Kineosporia sp. J2-2]|uniref:Pycsar effector protein domain-containing protein n=1 Tax=Kineosporia corallincola TaxID=2835133 RepID=A0ABS5TQ81_9ACTN|nr:hypothetical protein [Kineosporia corallincola]MBT0773269.1 hypothetical protein [Kineosporia corallincola]